MSDPSELSSPLHEHLAKSSHAPNEPQISPLAIDTVPIWPLNTEPGMQSPTDPAIAPVPQHSGPSQNPPLPSDSTSTFPIMRLPPELRLMILDQLFLDLTVRRQNSMMYRNDETLLQKHQVNDFRPLTNLLLTRKELNSEARKLWDEQYLHQCCFYFWHVSKLYDLAQMLDKMGEAYTEIKYVLRSSRIEDHVSQFCLAALGATEMSTEARNLTCCQPGVSSDSTDVFEVQFVERIHGPRKYAPIEPGTYGATDENPVSAVVDRNEAGTTFARAELIGPESCVISMHEHDSPLGDGGYRRDRYQQMHGKFSGIFWGGYDAARGYGRFKLWEAKPLCPGHGQCHCDNWHDPDNRSDSPKMLMDDIRERYSLLQRWHAGIVGDQKWLKLGGKPEDSTQELAEKLDDWTDFEYWCRMADDYWASWDFDEDEEEEQAQEDENEGEGGDGDEEEFE